MSEMDRLRQEGLALYAQGKFAEAKSKGQLWLDCMPQDIVALNLLGGCAKMLGNPVEAEQFWRKAIEIHPGFADAYYNLGVLYADAGNLGKAAAAYQQAISHAPDHADAWRNLATVQFQQAELSAADTSARNALQHMPENPELIYNLGVIQAAMGRDANAEALYRRALSLAPNDPKIINNLGVVLNAQRRFSEACICLRQAIELSPKMSEAHNNLGSTLLELGDFAGAEASCRKALEIKPDYADAAINLGNALRSQRRQAEAAEAFGQALQYRPDDAQALSQRVRAKRYAADWTGLAETDAAMKTWLANGRAGAVSPFALLVAPDFGGSDHLRASRSWAEYQFAQVVAKPPLVNAGEDYGHSRLRIAYLSADFYEHATSYLLAGVLEAHNDNQFDVYAYAYGPNPEDGARQRIRSACKVFRDVGALDDAAAAQLIAADEIDILIDLKGYTQDCRLGITARRPAPVIVSWLGYPGTLGHPRLADYIIGDPVVTPETHAAYYSETIAQLPDCYQPNDNKREIGPKPARASVGLPEEGFVFCSFNQIAKLNPEMFDVWCRLLRAVPDAVLWLLDPGAEAKANLLQEAGRCGVDAARIVFASKRPLTDHLGRLQCAELALDTYPYGSHTTGSDALWAGVPLVTCMGETFASRVAASLLHAVGLPELVTHSFADYFSLTYELATNREKLAGLRQRLAAQRLTMPLFDTVRFTRNLEALYARIWQARAPERAAAWHKKGLALLAEGDATSAISALRKALALDGSVAAYHANLGVALKGSGTPAERIALYRRATELAPEDPVNFANLAAVFSEGGDYAAAEKLASQALHLAPERAESWMNLGVALLGQQRYPAAAEAFDQAAVCRPGWLPALVPAGRAWRAAGDLLAALARFRQARQVLEGASAEMQHGYANEISRVLGELLASLHDAAGAEAAFREALVNAPGDPALLTDLGNSLVAQGKYDEAEACYRQVIACVPDAPRALVNLGTVFQMQGRHAEAIDYFERALALDPHTLAIYSNLGTSLTYSLAHSPADLMAAYATFDQRVAAPLRDTRPYAHERTPGRRLRIGYVSPDFRKHAVAYFALPLLAGHDHQQFEVLCYYNHRQQDEWTARFRAAAQIWVDCTGMSDGELAERIRADRVDILVDLAGHTEGGRLLVFARKPAPIQVTWLGYVTTTGLSAMDYRLTHADADPPGTESEYVETLVRLPGTMWCYQPLAGMPAVAPAPLLTNNYVTFGSFNRFSKNSSHVLACWARIMAAVPDSRLLMCIPEGNIRNQVAGLFARYGVRPERLRFFAKVSHEQFWDLHADVDIALDPFPFNGGTTTCETLWLGVPLVTCTGGTDSFAPRFASRMGRTFLNALGLSSLVTANEAEYEAAAVALARDRSRLVELRQSLRARMAASPLTDTTQFVESVETAYRQMWVKWCANA